MESTSMLGKFRNVLINIENKWMDMIRNPVGMRMSQAFLFPGTILVNYLSVHFLLLPFLLWEMTPCPDHQYRPREEESPGVKGVMNSINSCGKDPSAMDSFRNILTKGQFESIYYILGGCEMVLQYTIANFKNLSEIKMLFNTSKVITAIIAAISLLRSMDMLFKYWKTHGNKVNPRIGISLAYSAFFAFCIYIIFSNKDITLRDHSSIISSSLILGITISKMFIHPGRRYEILLYLTILILGIACGKILYDMSGREKYLPFTENDRFLLTIAQSIVGFASVVYGLLDRDSRVRSGDITEKGFYFMNLLVGVLGALCAFPLMPFINNIISPPEVVKIPPAQHDLKLEDAPSTSTGYHTLPGEMVTETS